jgi:phosphoglycerate dehydrogenase-like enzyme
VSQARRTPRVTIAPRAPSFIRDAVQAGGGTVVEPDQADVLVWMDPRDPHGIRDFLAAAPGVEWVQLPWAGVEAFARECLFDDGRTWTCGKGVYAEPVAEHALALGLAGLRHLAHYAMADGWGEPAGTSLYEGRVTIVGGGGITESLLGLLAPFRARVTVVRRHPAPLAGAAEVVAVDALHESLAAADLVVLALALTPETVGIMAAAELAAMQPHAWLVNVARGEHVVTDDLVVALRDGTIGGAGLDVTDPEPLPDGHPLWSLPNCVITPHTGNTPEMARRPLAARIRANVQRFAEDQPLLGLVDPALGY